jgi:hypothetical protein
MMMWKKRTNEAAHGAGQFRPKPHLAARSARDDAFAFGRVCDAFIRLPYLFQKWIGLDDRPVFLLPFPF